ncbi:MAG: hypothetical protein LEGION0398_MBIBDBAK_01010 [Legionellaceae bacterium]
MKSIYSFIGITLTCSIALTAHAAPHYYIQGELGYSKQAMESLNDNINYNDEEISLNGNVQKKQNTFGQNIAAGMLWDMNPKYAAGIQLSYEWNGKTSYDLNGNYTHRVGIYGNVKDKLTISSQSIDFLGIGQYQIHKKFALLGGLGAQYQFNKYTEAGTIDKTIVAPDAEIKIISFNDSKLRNGFAPEIMAGFLVTFNRNLSAGISYKHVFGHRFDGDFDTAPATLGLDKFMVNLRYTIA